MNVPTPNAQTIAFAKEIGKTLAISAATTTGIVLGASTAGSLLNAVSKRKDHRAAKKAAKKA